MDAVPYNFVDNVVMLTERQCLSQLQSLDNPLWESVAHLHSSKREYFSVYFRRTERGIEHVIFSYSNGCVTPDYVRKNRRFVRINHVLGDVLHDDYRRHWAKAVVLSEEKTKKVLEIELCPLYESCFSPWRLFLGLQKTLLSLLRDNLRFTTLKFAYYGEIAEEFLRCQIDHSKILEEVVLEESEWPSSVLALIKKFCLYQRRKNHVEACFSRTKIAGFDAVEYIEDFIDFWKQNNGHLQCTLSYEVDEETRTFLAEQEINDSRYYTRYLRHPTEKSIAHIWLGKFHGFVTFYRCVCNNNRPESRECWKKCYYQSLGINVSEESSEEE